MITSVNKFDTYSTDTTKREAKKALGKDDFMKLLVTQMQFQDPLKPMEHTEFTAQLAQFSSLDQLFSINDGMKKLSEKGGANSVQAVDFIGKEVKASGNKVYIGKDKSSVVIGYNLSDDVSNIKVNITDKDGNIVRTIKAGPQDAGGHNIDWDGRNNSGNMVSSGEYGFSISAVDINGKESEVPTNISGIVTGVSFENNVPYLQVGETRIMVTDVNEVKEVKK
ncbi:MAG: hypothetical protein HZA08_12905 [Nitrospirae bacterium]|nr:hypothetical protein [Nitrospirota bacterium]